MLPSWIIFNSSNSYSPPDVLDWSGLIETNTFAERYVLAIPTITVEASVLAASVLWDSINATPTEVVPIPRNSSSRLYETVVRWKSLTLKFLG